MTRSSRWPSTGRLFLLSVAIGVAGVLAAAAWQQAHRVAISPNVDRASALAPSHPLAPGIDLAAQLPLSAIGRLPERGYATVIDLRPDGEATDQPPSADIAAAARAAGVRFHYVPVPHGEIPDSAVAQLRVALAKSQPAGPVLIYCRSGRRAARTWALVEAQRAGGLSTDDIIQAVKVSGQDATDLRQRLDASVGQRKPAGAGA